MSGWHRNVERVIEAGRERGVDVRPVHQAEGAKTAADAAAAVGCEVGQIVKSLIFGVDGEIVLAYVSGSNQLDEARLAAAAGGERLLVSKQLKLSQVHRVGFVSYLMTLPLMTNRAQVS